jgi:hypothetical protein
MQDTQGQHSLRARLQFSGSEELIVSEVLERLSRGGAGGDTRLAGCHEL